MTFGSRIKYGRPRLGLRLASLDALLQDNEGGRAFLRSAPAAAARGGRLTGHATAKPWNPAVSRLPPRPASGRPRRPHGRHGGLLAGRIRCTPHTLWSLARARSGTAGIRSQV